MSNSLIAAIIRHIWPETGEPSSDAPDGVCVNCWGHYEYDGEIRKAVADRQVDVNNKQQRYAFIEEFTVKHIDGIRLKSEQGKKYCPKCKSFAS